MMPEMSLEEIEKKEKADAADAIKEAAAKELEEQNAQKSTFMKLL
jgi:hypothetical protein